MTLSEALISRHMGDLVFQARVLKRLITEND